MGAATGSARGHQQLVARLLLALLVGVLVALIAFGGPGQELALAQAAPSSPTPTGQTIEFINPSKTTSLEISDKDDGQDSAYHFVAAVGIVPSNPIVEFEIANNTGVLATYRANQVGPDTFEYFLTETEADGFNDGEYILRAILFSGSTPVDNDEEVVEISNEGGSPTTPDDLVEQGQTVEIDSPENGGPLVVFIGSDGAAHFNMDFTASVGTTFITGFYSQQPPGSEPQFEACTNGAQNLGGNSDGTLRSGRYRCSLITNDSQQSVTAVALVANDSSPSTGFRAEVDNAADGHRVFAPSNSASPSPSNTSPAPDSECEDGTDNDGDGFTDFPEDPSCSSVSDATEAPQDQVANFHARTVRLEPFRHVDIFSNKRDGLQIKGQVLANDGFEGCEAQVPVKVPIRAGREWVTRKTDTTNDNGIFKVLVRDFSGRYRAVATKFQISNPNNSNETDECLKARDIRRHQH